MLKDRSQRGRLHLTATRERKTEDADLALDAEAERAEDADKEEIEKTEIKSPEARTARLGDPDISFHIHKPPDVGILNDELELLKFDLASLRELHRHEVHQNPNTNPPRTPPYPYTLG